jgi:hypothetical protein
MTSINERIGHDFCSDLYEDVEAITPKNVHLLSPGVLKVLAYYNGIPVIQGYAYTIIDEEFNLSKKMLFTLLPLLVYRVSPFFYEMFLLTGYTTRCRISENEQKTLILPYELPETVRTKQYFIKNEPYENPVLYGLTLKQYMATQPLVHFLYVHLLQVAMACQTLVWSKIKHNQLLCDAVDVVKLNKPFEQLVTSGHTTVLFIYDHVLQHTLYLSKWDSATEEKTDVNMKDFGKFFTNFYHCLNKVYDLSLGQKVELVKLVVQSDKVGSVIDGLERRPVTGESAGETNLFRVFPKDVGILPVQPVDEAFMTDLMETYNESATPDLLLSNLIPQLTTATAAAAIVPPHFSPFFTTDPLQNVFLSNSAVPLPTVPPLFDGSEELTHVVDIGVDSFLELDDVLVNLKALLQSNPFVRNNVKFVSASKKHPLKYTSKPEFFHNNGQVNVAEVFSNL